MTKEEKQLLLKELCARLPYGVVLRINNVFIESLYTILNHRNTSDWFINGCNINIISVKPYLRPMSSMTEEEQQKYYDLTHQEDDDIWAKCLFDKMVDFCNEKHLDYRGLIPMGLALEAPEEMYKTK